MFTKNCSEKRLVLRNIEWTKRLNQSLSIKERRHFDENGIASRTLPVDYTAHFDT
jgi:hypothetical protein